MRSSSFSGLAVPGAVLPALLFFLSLLSVTSGPAEGSPRLAVTIQPVGYSHFRVGIRQGGVPLAVKNRTVVLKRRPFVLVMESRKPCHLWINASFDDTLFHRARKSLPLDKVFTPYHIGADFDFNPHRQMYLSPPLPQKAGEYWKIVHNNYYVESRRDHRCDSASISPGGCTCNRTIASLWQKKTRTPISRVKKPTLYLVFFKARCNKQHTQCVELKREGLALGFR